MNAAELLGIPSLDRELARVEAALRETVRTIDPFLSEVAGHLAKTGGKRLRPALAVAAAMVEDATVSDDVVNGGVAVELVHLGSLYHDDVMDDADIRHSAESVNHRWGNLVAILAGDFLLARGSEVAAPLGTEVAGLLAATIARLCEGQVEELQTAFDVNRSEEAYLHSIAGKTAALYSASCRIGALTANLPRVQVDALTSFGAAFGMMFQIRDDVLDVVATDEALGKPTGKDLLEGTYSLPIIRALASADVGPELAALLGHPVAGPERDKARAIVRASGAVETSLEVARGYAEEAAAALAPLGERPVALALSQAGPRLLDRIDF